MSEIPTTRYARSGDVHIAYCVAGEGPPDVIWVPGFVSHLEIYWEHPVVGHLLRRMSSACRLIIFDKRGTGLSDRTAQPPTLEERIDDVRAVLDEVGVERAFVCGNSEGGPMSVLFAATHADRTLGLLLYGSAARFYRAPDYPLGGPPEDLERTVAYLEKHWGEGVMTSVFTPSVADDPDAVAFMQRLERNGASPSAAIANLRLLADIDVRHVLPTIQTPTLVMHAQGDLAVAAEHGRFLAENIPGARYVELPWPDHGVATIEQADAVADALTEFFTGRPPVHEPDRVFATLLFTDIVSSTERSAAVGDHRWRQVMDQHDTLVRRELDRFRGQLVNPTGDGMLAAFDGPARAVRCAQSIGQHLREAGIVIRAGLHAGEVETRGDDLSGIAVNIAARVSALADANEVLVSRTVTDLVAGSGLKFDDRGEHELKGVPGSWQLYAVRS